MNRSIFHTWQPQHIFSANTQRTLKSTNLNFGPQHPAAHGVLRLILQMNGEIIERMDTHVGLLHRGSEKLIETKPYHQSTPYFDRMDYVSMLAQEHAYCLAVEALLKTYNYTTTQTTVRVLFDEITRNINHLLCVACHALDVGSMTSVFWAFEEREKLMEYYERVSGARMHAAFYRPNESNFTSITHTLLSDILDFTRNFFTTLNEMHNILTYNKIWKQRLINVGLCSLETCIRYGLTGVLARGSGIKRDLRQALLETYGNYYYFNFRGYIGTHGDSYDRFLIRMNEMGETTNIITQCINTLTCRTKRNTTNFLSTDLILKFTKQILTTKKHTSSFMENTILHFKNWAEGSTINSGVTYQAVESPKGEFGVFLFSDNTNKPYRCKIRSPALHHLQVLPVLAKGHFLADLATLVGTIDIVFGEIDR